MFRSIVLLAAVAALGAAPAFAAEEASASAPVQSQPAQPTATPRHCWKENPFNEYRDCVNASTRDPNAKIRMA